MSTTDSRFFPSVVDWLNRSATIKSAVLFGSSAAVPNADEPLPNQWADIDLHLVAADSLAIENTVWSRELPEHGFSFRTTRRATGGVRKVTLVFSSGQIDMVIVPIAVMRIAATAFRTGLYRKIKVVGAAPSSSTPSTLAVARNSPFAVCSSGRRVRLMRSKTSRWLSKCLTIPRRALRCTARTFQRSACV